MSLRRDPNLGELDLRTSTEKIQKKNFLPKLFRGRSPQIDKYASENGATAAVRKFKNSYSDMKESTVHGFKSNYEEELKKAKQQSRTMTKALPEKKRMSIDAWGY